MKGCIFSLEHLLLALSPKNL